MRLHIKRAWAVKEWCERNRKAGPEKGLVFKKYRYDFKVEQFYENLSWSEFQLIIIYLLAFSYTQMLLH